MRGASLRLPVTEQSQVGEARRVASALATRLEFGETEKGKLAIIVTEAATNLIKHAKQGEIVLRAIEEAPANGIELLILDRGPGIADIARSLHDGYSTAGTPGTGLGAIKRLSDAFEIHSHTERGTAILSQVRAHSLPYSPSVAAGLTVSAVCLPVQQETECGDSWAVAASADRTIITLVDGLGHGPNAAKAANAAIDVFAQYSAETPEQILQRAHQALRPTRGAAMAICEISHTRQKICFTGVGNIAGAAIVPSTNDSRHFVSVAGILGHEVRKIQVFEYAWTRESIVILHSDGLMNRWRLDTLPGLRARHASLIAGVLYRDFRRDSDDVTVAVAKFS